MHSSPSFVNIGDKYLRLYGLTAGEGMGLLKKLPHHVQLGLTTPASFGRLMMAHAP